MIKVLRNLTFYSLILSAITIEVSAQQKRSQPLAPEPSVAARFDQVMQRIKQENEQLKSFLAQHKSFKVDRFDKLGRTTLVGFTADGYPLEYASTNKAAGTSVKTVKLFSGGGMGLSLSGAGYTMYEWDEGYVRDSHVQLTGRVTSGDGYLVLSSHSTHVGGTLIASGSGNPDARGMMPAGNLVAYDWNNDITEMTTAASNGALVSNHSYGHVVGWSFGTPWRWYGRDTDFEDYKFGWYNSHAQAYDLIANAYPAYLIVKAAGNNRSGGSANGPGIGIPYDIWDTNLGTWVSSTAARSPNTGYDILPTWANAKNILTVGACAKYTYVNSSSPVMSSFSSWGPTDDGRIKPDITAPGVSITSTDRNNDTHYSIKNGTSMASPVVAGSALMLQNHHHNVHGTHMNAAMLKGLIIHSADEAGPWMGPDYKFGWGVLNTETAANVIRNLDDKHIMVNTSLSNGGSYKIVVSAKGGEPLFATICWNDPAGSFLPDPAVDDSTKALVHDLDLHIKDLTTNAITKPWVLNLAYPDNAAYQGDNIRDNVEKVYIGTPTADGLYEITINHKGSLTGAQAVALLVTGVKKTSVWLGGSGSLTDPTKWTWGGVPGASEEATIPAGTVNAAGSLNLKGLIVNSGATLNMPSNATITAENLAIYGSVTGSNLAIVMNGSISSRISGSVTCKSLTLSTPHLLVDAPSTGLVTCHQLTSTVPVVQQIGPNSKIRLMFEGNTNPYLGPLPSGSSITGNYEVFNKVQGTQAAWYFLGATVDGQTIQAFNNREPLKGTYPGAGGGATNLYFYDPANPAQAGWVTPSNATNSLGSGTGVRLYLRSNFFNQGYLNFTGTPYVGQLTKNLTYCTTGCATWSGFGPANGYNLVANPYAAPIDWHSVVKNNTSNSYAVFNKSVYGTYSAGSGIGTNGAGRYIASNQAFFAEATAGGASLVFNETDKAVAQTTNILRTGQIQAIRLSITSNGLTDEIALPIIQDAIADLQQPADYRYDADKMLNGALDLAISWPANQRPLAIKAFDGSSLRMPLSISAANGQATLDISGLAALPLGTTVRLVDLTTGMQHQLDGLNQLMLTSLPTSFGPANYELVIAATPTTIGRLNQTEFILMPNPATDQVTISNLKAEDQVQVTDITGRTMPVNRIGHNQLDLSKLGKGLYQVNIVSGEGMKTLKLVKD